MDVISQFIITLHLIYDCHNAMIATIKILWSSLKMAVQELRMNKLRTFLSLLGITIGIFCIIAVFTATNSLESNIRKGLEALGSDVIFIQKWPWDGGPDMPWWKFVNRPQPEYKELRYMTEKTHTVQFAAFAFSSGNKRIDYKSESMEGVEFLPVTEDYIKIQSLKIIGGRYFAGKENDGANVAILGGNIWDGLFGSPEAALGKVIRVAGRPVRVIGVLKKKGSGMDAINYDNTVMVPYAFGKTVVDERLYGDPFITVKAKPGISVKEMKDDLTGVMRAIRRLRPTEEDNFSLNEITSASGNLESIFVKINIGGIIIAMFALIVGGFGIANIMFVTVKERTNIIGLKKAIGARKKVILMEFLLEAIMLCLVGGGLGLLLVYMITLVLNMFDVFPVALTMKNIIIGLSVSTVVGVIAGFIPAWSASKLDPVVAIRST
ncbi:MULTISPECIES: ABC transporter permease [unclassified Chitinophaga]|uniref:ABC transporter permease n=1 Tax=unclassified Chitinophaga TaxID=2619133 RepID=UPI001C6FC847|nr:MULTISPECIES: ABC transporter permease [unclassified Chitinophaga]WPV65536.1 ABC transporter permease [Chitinophaga sp. LS1]